MKEGWRRLTKHKKRKEEGIGGKLGLNSPAARHSAYSFCTVDYPIAIERQEISRQQQVLEVGVRGSRGSSARHRQGHRAWKLLPATCGRHEQRFIIDDNDNNMDARRELRSCLVFCNGIWRYTALGVRALAFTD